MPNFRLLPCGIFVLFVGILLLLRSVTAVIVRFRDCNNEVLSSTESNYSCLSLPDWSRGQVCKFDRLSYPSCVTLFWNNECTIGSGEEVEVMTIGSEMDFYFPAADDYPPPKSYRLCSQLEEQKNLVRDDNYAKLIQSIDGFAKYSKMCGCAKLPLASQELLPLSEPPDLACVRLHLKEDCSGSYYEISIFPLDDLSYLLDVALEKTLALELCHPTSACPNRLNGTIIKIEVATSPTKSQLEAASDLLEMGSKTRFQNNGSATLVQEYAVKRTITESKRVEIAKSISTVHHVRVSHSVTAQINANILFAKGSIKGTLSAAYDWTRNETDETRTQLLLTSQKEFSVMKRIEIPPCSEYTVTSYIKMLENIPIQYIVFMELRGFYGDHHRRMNVRELQRQLGDMKLVEVVDNFTIIAKEAANMSLSMGVESVMDGRGSIMTGCQNQLTTTSDATGNVVIDALLQAIVIVFASLYAS